MAPHSRTLAWKIPWMEEAGGLQSMGSWRVRHDWVTSLSLFTFMHWRRQWQPTALFLPGDSQGRGSLVGCRVWGRAEWDMTGATQQQRRQQGCGEVITLGAQSLFLHALHIVHILARFSVLWEFGLKPSTTLAFFQFMSGILSIFVLCSLRLFYSMHTVFNANIIICNLSEKKVKSLSRVRPFVTPWTAAHQASLSMGFSRQEYWSGVPLPSPEDLSDPGIEPGCPPL